MLFPPKKSNAMSGSQFAQSIMGIVGAARENAIASELLMGNVPDFMRNIVHVSSADESLGYRLVYTVIPRFLCIGTDNDHFYVPMAPGTAQIIADACGAMLPTYKMVQDIFIFSSFRLVGVPLRWGPQMTTTMYYKQHSDIVCKQLEKVPFQALCDGYKKNVIVSNRMETNPNSVFIYGWMKDQSGNFWQGLPLYPGHSRTYADYSHGIRLVGKRMALTNLQTQQTMEVDAFDILKDNQLCHLLSAEGPLSNPRY